MVRGEVFRLRPGRAAQGREQRGERFGVIVQADELLGMSTALVAPTSTRARPATFRPEVELDGTLTRVLADQT
ncbi:MAG: type II toxin-antitoxin system PemK/MazF family toxin, partial [Actinomycetota bacterium]|nr:type II toxin-antitoxin system PemK/MazF family toxin [Actinomycetota bacterium]